MQWPSRGAATQTNHSHPTAAKIRTMASTTLDRFISSVGYEPYVVSISEADMKRGYNGFKRLYHAKDLLYAFREDPEGRGDFIKLADVDYYVDMPSMLSLAKPMILWTATPKHVAGPLQDGAFTFLESGQYHQHMAGGATYQHELWDYETDHLVSKHWWGSVSYFVETMVCPQDPTRSIIGLFPARVVLGPVGWFVPGRPLRRRSVVQRGTNHVWSTSRSIVNDRETIEQATARLKHPPTASDVLIDAGMTEYTSFGIAGEFRSAIIPTNVLKIAWLKYKRAVQSPLSSVESYLRTEATLHPWLQWWSLNRMSFVSMAALLVAMFEDCPDLVTTRFTDVQVALPIPDEVSYTPYRGQALEDEKCVVRSLLPPGRPHLVAPAVGPTRGKASDEQCVEGRITSIKNVRHGTLRDEEAARWFIRKICEASGTRHHTLVPKDFEEVFARQARPTQRSILQLAEDWAEYTSRTLKTFMKAEGYGKVTDPRNITTIPGSPKMRYSRFTYALQEVVKHVHWYAFSKNPAEIGRAIAALLRGRKRVVPTDFSRWDGRVSEWLTEIFLSWLKYLFAPEYHEELERDFRAQYKCKARTAFGVVYDHDFDMPSGSPHTSLFNSLMNAFINFLARVEAGEDYEDAWAGLGIYGGDDGLTAEIDASALEKTCERLGCSLKAKVLQQGEPVDFLGRIFYNAWTDDTPEGPVSTIDLARQLSKLFVTASPLTVPRGVALARKAAGYGVTDANTPVLREFVGAISRVFPKEYAECAGKLAAISNDRELAARLAGDRHRFDGDINYFATYLDHECRFNNRVERDGDNGGHITEHLAQTCGIKAEELRRIAATLARVRTVNDLDRVGCTDPVRATAVEISARVGDDLVVLQPKPESGPVAGDVQPPCGQNDRKEVGRKRRRAKNARANGGAEQDGQREHTPSAQLGTAPCQSNQRDAAVGAPGGAGGDPAKTGAIPLEPHASHDDRQSAGPSNSNGNVARVDARRKRAEKPARSKRNDTPRLSVATELHPPRHDGQGHLGDGGYDETILRGRDDGQKLSTIEDEAVCTRVARVPENAATPGVNLMRSPRASANDGACDVIVTVHSASDGGAK
jgi:hypothetical protein